ncbi:hypothetical protein [Burkholderia gladioli]|uniref:hypothetical protein n=1 Tax=Burkholderia gladioli TaxID=28095 RepID=UPI0016407325|nr:hypothetical protein [Burkholderia gladioli]
MASMASMGSRDKAPLTRVIEKSRTNNRGCRKEPDDLNIEAWREANSKRGNPACAGAPARRCRPRRASPLGGCGGAHGALPGRPPFAELLDPRPGLCRIRARRIGSVCEYVSPFPPMGSFHDSRFGTSDAVERGNSSHARRSSLPFPSLENRLMSIPNHDPIQQREAWPTRREPARDESAS